MITKNIFRLRGHPFTLFSTSIGKTNVDDPSYDMDCCKMVAHVAKCYTLLIVFFLALLPRWYRIEVTSPIATCDHDRIPGRG